MSAETFVEYTPTAQGPDAQFRFLLSAPIDAPIEFPPLQGVVGSLSLGALAELCMADGEACDRAKRTQMLRLGWIPNIEIHTHAGGRGQLMQVALRGPLIDGTRNTLRVMRSVENGKYVSSVAKEDELALPALPLMDARRSNRFIRRRHIGVLASAFIQQHIT